MTPAQAAEVIGCSPQQVRTLIRNGRLKARRTKLPNGSYHYSVDPGEAEAYRDRPQPRGWPRGQKRTN